MGRRLRTFLSLCIACISLYTSLNLFVSAWISPTPEVPSGPTDLSNGLIVFWHIPKTGGITIRNYFERLAITDPTKYKSIVISNKAEWKRRQRQLRKYSSAQTKKLVYVEIHGGGDDLHYDTNMLDFVRTARTNGIPTFAFTLLRDPIQHALSHFHFYHTTRRGPNHARRFPYVPSPTEHDLRNYLISNPQCLFLLHGEVAYQHRDKLPTEQECRQVWQNLRNDLDWAGATESLSTALLPWMQSHFGMSPPVTHANVNPTKILPWSNLTDATREFLRHATQWDAQMYATVSTRMEPVRLP